MAVVVGARAAVGGAYRGAGRAGGTVSEPDPRLMVGDGSEPDAAKLQVGSAAVARLVSGETLSGVVRYVAHDADRPPCQ